MILLRGDGRKTENSKTDRIEPTLYDSAERVDKQTNESHGHTIIDDHITGAKKASWEASLKFLLRRERKKPQHIACSLFADERLWIMTLGIQF